MIAPRQPNGANNHPGKNEKQQDISHLFPCRIRWRLHSRRLRPVADQTKENWLALERGSLNAQREFRARPLSRPGGARIGRCQRVPFRLRRLKLCGIEADLDPAQFQPTQPKWNSLASSDTRAAWTGKWPGTELPLRIEAATFQGKPVFFRLIGDWTQPPRMQAPPDAAGKKAFNVVLIFVITGLLICAIWLARRNHRQGRGDIEGAMRLARITFVLLIFLWLLRSHLVPDFPLFGLMMIAIATSSFMSALIFVLYLALEPYVRRYWPHAIISWSRLLTGRIRDPLVGRDILFGVLLGVVWLIIFKVGRIVTMRMGDAPELLANGYLLGARAGIAVWAAQLPMTILATLQFFFIFLILKVLLKRDWLATVVFVAIFSAAKSLGENHIVATLAIVVPIYLILSLIVYRFGLVPLACAIFTVDMLANVPFTADISAWYFGTTMFALFSVVALAAWGFYYSLDPERRVGAA